MIYAPDKRNRPSASRRRRVLFVAAGELARKTLDALTDVADDLNVSIAGEFGFVGIRSGDSGQPQVTVADEWPGPQPAKSEPEQPLPLAADDVWQAGAIGSDEFPPNDAPTDPLEDEVIGLLRRMRSVHTDAGIGRRWETWFEVYVIVDLRQPNEVRAALKAANVILQETTRAELTGILITGRTEAVEDSRDNEWRDGLREVVQANDDPESRENCLLHRAYLLDGVNTREEWIRDQNHLCHTAAEFIVHHGLSPYRDVLRQHERSRYSPKQPFREVLGSFACRTVSSTLECAPAAIADVLMDEDLAQSSQPSLSAEECVEIGKTARGFEAQIDDIFDKRDEMVEEQRRQSEARDDRKLPFGRHGWNIELVSGVLDEMIEKLRTAIHRVCANDPRRRFLEFTRQLNKSAGRCRARARVLERRNERETVAYELRKKHRGKPKRTRSQIPPEYGIRVKPIPGSRVKIGGGLLVAGVILAFLLGEWGLWPILVGVACMFAGVLVMDMPALAPLRHRKVDSSRIGTTCVGEGYTEAIEWKLYVPPDYPPQKPFRCRPPISHALLGIALLALGIGLVMYVIRFTPGFQPPLIPTVIVAVATLIAVLALWQRKGRIGYLRPEDREHDEEATDVLAREGGPPVDRLEFSVNDYPLAYFPRTLGLQRPVAFVVLFGLLFWLIAAWPAGLRTDDMDLFAMGRFPVAAEYAAWFARAGLLLFTVGLLMVFLPESEPVTCGKIDPQPPPLPVVDIEGRPRIGDQVDDTLRDLTSWLDRLLEATTPTPVPKEQLHWPGELPPKTFLDVIVNDWPRRIADQCRGFVEEAIGLPENWANCFVDRFRNRLRGSRLEPEHVDREIATRAVQQWFQGMLRRYTWGDLIRLLKPERTWLGRFFERSLAPMWPSTSRYVGLDQGVAVVDAKLKAAAAAQEANRDSRWRICEVEWPATDEEHGQVVLVRLVQGLPESYLKSLLFPTEVTKHV